MKPFAFGLATALSLAANVSLGQGETDVQATRGDLQARQFSILGHAGLYTPLGLGGVSVEYSALPWLVASAGAGTNANSLELAAGGKLRLMLADRMITGFGFGFGYGQPYSPCWVPMAPPRCSLPDSAPNAHAELYLETRPTKTFVSRLYGGLVESVQLGHRPVSGNAGLVPYIGVAFGTLF